MFIGPRAEGVSRAAEPWAIYTPLVGTFTCTSYTSGAHDTLNTVVLKNHLRSVEGDGTRPAEVVTERDVEVDKTNAGE